MSIRNDDKHDEDKHDNRDDHARDGGVRPVDQAVTRWIHRRPGGTRPEDRAADLFRRASAAPAFGQQARMRVYARLASETSHAPSAAASVNGTAGRWSRGRAPALHWGIAAGLLLGSGVVIAARGVDHWWKSGPSSKTRPSPRERTALHRPARAPRQRDAVSGVGAVELLAPEAIGPPALVASPVVSAAPVPIAGAAPGIGTVVVRAPAAPMRPPGDGTRSDAPVFVPAPESKLATEARMLNTAIGRLRQGRDAGGALGELDQYLLRFPNGTLVGEARTARADALLMLGHEAEALVALNALTLQDSGRDQELRVIRGELGAASDCARAIADFDRILSTTASPALVERALYGRAVCRSRQGRQDEATRDAERYLETFPGGRFRREAQCLIAGGAGDMRDTESGRRAF